MDGVNVVSVMPADELEIMRDQLVQHPMYQLIHTMDELRSYMQFHVFAVWDFMSLLKRLQKDVTCVEIPWIPSSNATYARFLNEIVLGEESDEDGLGGFSSHFELYLSAMQECGANTKPIIRFLGDLHNGIAPMIALQRAEVPDFVYRFVAHTLEVAERGKTHEVCAAFFYGREDIIPDMFQKMVDELSRQTDISRFLYYLRRHIEVDSDQHGPLAKQLLADLCGEDPKKLEDAHQAAARALKARVELWDGVVENLSLAR